MPEAAAGMMLSGCLNCLAWMWRIVCAGILYGFRCGIRCFAGLAWLWIGASGFRFGIRYSLMVGYGYNWCFSVSSLVRFSMWCSSFGQIVSLVMG